MSAWAFVRTLCTAAASAALATGCYMQTDSGGGMGGGPPGSGSGSGGSSGPSTQPILVDVDPNQTMNATPGDGVGVFIEYQTGGHWHVWWTCDTNKTGLSCAFDNTITVATGTLTNLASQLGAPPDSATQANPQQIEATTTTTSAVDGITFDTPFSPGQTPVITLNALMNGVADGTFLFFVQNGQINGGYQGTLTDPLMLEPSKP